MKFRLLATSLLLTLPSFGQNKGTPLPGLREERQPEAERPAETPAVPAPPDVSALRKKAEEGDEGDEAATDGAAEATPWSVLGLEEHSPWEAVERARRTLLQQYHPDRLGHVSPLVQKLAEREFKRVSEAYDALRARR